MSLHFVILGGGLSGLAHGWFLKQAFGPQLRLTILEKGARPGGWLETRKGDGFLFEQGPRSFRPKGKGKETLALVEALGLQEELLAPDPEASRRYIYHQDRLIPLPRCWWQIPFSPLTRGWMKALWRDTSMPKGEEEQSVQAFFEHRLGHEWVERLVDPFVSGIYAGDCRQLSLRSCFPVLHEWEQKCGSLFKGALWHRPAVDSKSSFVQAMQRFPLFSFKKGMESLPKALAMQLGESVLCNQAASRLVFKEKGVEVFLENGRKIETDRVISTLPAFALGPLLAGYPGLSASLQTLRYATVTVVNLGFRSSVLPFKGFGYLVPSQVGSPVLGCIWDSSIFPQQNQGEQQTRLTVMLGGMHHPEMGKMAEHMVVERALQALHQQLKISCCPDVIQVKKAEAAIPQYELGYEKWKNELQERVSHLSPFFLLSGSGFAGVSINDCVAEARKNSEGLFHLLSK